MAVTDDDRFLCRALELACDNALAGGRPYGAVVVRAGQLVAEAVNELHLRSDPSAHAEMLALRAAAATLERLQLDDCTVYASGQPCPMCLAALHLASVRRVVFAYSNADGEPYGFTTAALYRQMALPLTEQALEIVQGDASLWPDNPFALASRG
ncbi:tRNA(Arg) A34 adenosine deaminase TadA [Nannocystis exedens]|uniref:tRNA(Arg) A34 adenosine deaminase TadA n=1 Tax=Nannocystis exedens TaxID=54 RepID=A0A1I1W6U7_9BACT|nr:tRNA-specific adenosine deaminase [Nannocystis exedens]SFD90852.1 tRNA(Arg) A34 adenosine deaminase TadA [Nannocystis exedens]